MPHRENAYTPPRSRLLCWLTDPGTEVPAHIRGVLLKELFSSNRAVVMGVVNGLLLNVVALLLHGGRAFLLFLILDLTVAVARLAIIRRAEAAAAADRPTPTDLYLSASIAWCALQGVMAMASMMSGIAALQILGGTTIMALLGPIAARSFPSPRFCMLLICCCDLPFVAGAALSGRPWLLVLVLQTPLLLIGSVTVYGRFQSMLVDTLSRQHDSQYHAHHDPLTDLLNRFGLAEGLRVGRHSASHHFTVFYLDLDGFKRVNDTCGHATGDRLLQAVAQRLREGVRASDVVARVGGDEFVVVAPGMPADIAAGFAAGLIRRIAADPYVLDENGPLRIGTSIGFACAPEDGTDMAELQRQADEALYIAKAAGKGVARRWQGDRIWQSHTDAVMAGLDPATHAVPPPPALPNLARR